MNLLQLSRLQLPYARDYNSKFGTVLHFAIFPNFKPKCRELVIKKQCSLFFILQSFQIVNHNLGHREAQHIFNLNLVKFFYW